MKRLTLHVLLLIAACGLTAPALVAQDATVRQRMEQRLPVVDALKQRKLAGENNRGLLEARGRLSPDEQKTLDDENRDRTAVYEAIAKQAGIAADAVGRRRAEQIARLSSPGVWVQAADGTWSEKR